MEKITIDAVFTEPLKTNGTLIRVHYAGNDCTPGCEPDLDASLTLENGAFLVRIDMEPWELRELAEKLTHAANAIEEGHRKFTEWATH